MLKKDNPLQINSMDLPASAPRIIANLSQRYATWLAAERVVAPGRLTWKTVSGREYLYRIVDGAGNGTSLGARSPETEAAFEEYQAAKQRATQLANQLLQDGALYRALQLPMVPTYAGDVLRRLDIAGQLGRDGVLVVGTNALTAYQIEAQRLLGPDLSATDDFDMTWVRPGPYAGLPVLDVLKKGDRTWTVNQERPFQAVNGRGDEIELLLPEALASDFPRRGGLRPLPLPEQDWLLPGRPVDQVVVAVDRKPARVVAPDPRWFALHKLWLADKPERSPLKKGKDRAQGGELLDLVADHMPHYPLDEAFAAELPAPLLAYFERWLDTRPAMNRPE